MKGHEKCRFVARSRAFLPHVALWLWASSIAGGCQRTGRVDSVSGPSTAAESRTIVVPTTLRLLHGRVQFRRADAKRVSVHVDSGVFLGTRITAQENGHLLSMQLQSGMLEPDAPNAIEDWTLSGNPPPHGPVVFTIEIFQTTRPPEHMWDPGPGAEGYKTLRTDSFQVNPRR